MKNWLTIFLVGCVFSMYIFPFTFTFLPVGNTKIFIAVLGLILWGANMITGRESLVSKSMVKVSAWAMAVSLISLISMAYNNATDTAYAGYIVSMWVWVGAAYFVIKCIKFVHHAISVELICKYFIAVCLFQCVASLLNEFYPSFAAVVNSLVIQHDQEYLELVDRMYGIGAAFDTAGTRFACALVMLAYLLPRVMNNQNSVWASLYIIAFVFISIVGNMVARTTSVGMVLGLGLIAYDSRLFTLKLSQSYVRIFQWTLIVIIVSIPIISYVYSNPNVKPLFDFAFEGFINMAETGTWETHSTNELLAMWSKLPVDMKTWIIGDGYFLSPYASNPFYVGIHTWTYYMGTDVGYLRLIYYFGIIGLSIFALFLVNCSKECINNNPKDKILFIMILIMNFIIWAKVATDLFCIFALFLMLDPSIQEEEPNTNLTTVEQ